MTAALLLVTILPWSDMPAVRAVESQVPVVEAATAQGQSAMVVAAHPLAAAAGIEVLRQGGNAVDAAVATAFALAVVEPYSSGLGGGGFAVTFASAGRRVRTLDFREKAPSAAYADMYLRGGQADTSLSQNGPLSVAVPGLVRGLWQLHREQGRLPWPVLLEPAVDLAKDGFPVSEMLAERIAAHASRFNPAARAVFLPHETVPPVGSLLRQPDLASTLAAIAARGPEAFYTGPVADGIAAAVQQAGGLLTSADLAAYRPQWREPVHGSYRGLDIYSMGPPSSGGVLLVEMLNILEGYDLAAAGWGSAAALHPVVEAMKFAFADRSRRLGDPDYVDVPAARLMARSYADSLRARIQPARALPPAAILGGGPWPPESHETTHLSVLDSAGNAVSATLTINLTFGSGLLAGGTGVLLNDEMDDFAIAPGVPNAFGLVGGQANAVAAGKRPLSSMTPTIMLDGGRVRMVLGSPGGSHIITAVLQVILDVVDYHLDMGAAVAAPRIHHQWSPEDVFYEANSLSPAAAVQLGQWGHRLTPIAGIGNVQALLVDLPTQQITGASDPRGMGQACGY